MRAGAGLRAASGVAAPPLPLQRACQRQRRTRMVQCPAARPLERSPVLPGGAVPAAQPASPRLPALDPLAGLQQGTGLPLVEVGVLHGAAVSEGNGSAHAPSGHAAATAAADLESSRGSSNGGASSSGAAPGGSSGSAAVAVHNGAHASEQQQRQQQHAQAAPEHRLPGFSGRSRSSSSNGGPAASDSDGPAAVSSSSSSTSSRPTGSEAPGAALSGAVSSGPTTIVVSGRGARAGSRSSSPDPGGDAEAVAAVAVASASATTTGRDGTATVAGALYPPSERSQIQDSWDALMRWSKFFRRQQADEASPIEAARKIVVFGGGSFGTAMGCSLARKRPELDVVLLLRDKGLAADINQRHCNSKYLPDFTLPPNMRATTDIGEAADASYAVHAVPVQHSRAFLEGIRDVLPPSVPIVCVSKGLEVGTGCMMSEVIPSALGRRQPATFISGPSFAREVMEGRPTGVVAASRDAKLARQVQQLFASPSMRVNTSTDVIGVEICGALKNVLAIAAGIVEGLDLGHNALAALIAQGCAEIRWLAEKLGAKPQTMSGLSGLGDIMLTCYGDLSRNRRVGMRLGRGEALEDILASSSQVAEGVATAGVVVSLARRYRVSLPVLTAVAQVLDNNLTPAQAVAEIMSLPQIEER